jgi:hypothetical protein
MWLTGDHFMSVFWIAVIPAFFAFAVIVVAVHELRTPASRRFAGSLDALEPPGAQPT